MAFPIVESELTVTTSLSLYKLPLYCGQVTMNIAVSQRFWGGVGGDLPYVDYLYAPDVQSQTNHKPPLSSLGKV